LEQIVVNVQDPSIERLTSRTTSENNAVLPFSILAPNADFWIDQLSITGQLVAQDLKLCGACNHVSCPIFHAEVFCARNPTPRVPPFNCPCPSM
jgi:hypothetical protein